MLEGFGLDNFWNSRLSLYFCFKVLVLGQHRQGLPPDLPLGHGVRVRGILDFSSEEQSEKEEYAESVHQHLKKVMFCDIMSCKNGFD